MYGTGIEIKQNNFEAKNQFRKIRYVSGCAQCAETSWQVQKFATRQKLSDPRRMTTGLSIAARNTNIYQDQTAKLRKWFINAAEVLQICYQTLSFSFVSVWSVRCGPRPYCFVVWTQA